MALLGNAVLAVWNEVDPDFEDDFNEWYFREHIPERTMVPDLTRGRRYRAEEGSPRYMAFYEATSMHVLTHGPYRLQLDNPTAWTQRIMPHFRFMQRGLCDVGASVGDGMGGAAAVVHLTPVDVPRLHKWITHRDAVARTSCHAGRRRGAFLDPRARGAAQPNHGTQSARRARSSGRMGHRRRDHGTRGGHRHHRRHIGSQSESARRGGAAGLSELPAALRARPAVRSRTYQFEVRTQPAPPKPTRPG